jgi:hypothetical protein
MRRTTRLRLVIVVLLVILGGLYTAGWFVAAGRVESELSAWAEAQRARGLDLTWGTVGVGGYPLSFRVELSDVLLRDPPHWPGGEIRMPQVSGSAHPWSFRIWHVMAPIGFTVSSPPLTAQVKTADGTIVLGNSGGGSVWLELDQPGVDVGVALKAEAARLWLTLPPTPPQSHTDPLLSLGLELSHLNVPTVPPPLYDLSLGFTVMGPIPAGAPKEAAAAWRDAGGTVEVQHLGLQWGVLELNGSGTLALDPDLQPEGALSGAIAGYDKLIAAFVDSGRLRGSDAQIARLALSFLAKPGPEGRPEIATSFTLQNGDMRLGPIKLGKAPHLDWK